MRGLAVPLLLIFFLFPFSSATAAREAVISSVSIKGNGVISRKDIESVISEIVPEKKFFFRKHHPDFDRFTVERNIEYLRQFLAGNGYYDSSVVWRTHPSADGRDLDLKIDIQLGRPVIVSGIKFNMEGDIPSEHVSGIIKSLETVPLEEGRRFSVQRFKKAKGVIKNTLVEMGYAAASVDSKAEIWRRERRAMVTFSIVPGRIHIFGDINISVSDKNLRDLVADNISYKTGEPSSPSKLFDSKRRLMGLGYFDSVSITSETDKEAAVVSTVVETVRKKTMTLQFGAGAGRVDVVRGRVKLKNRNFLNLNRVLEISAGASFASQWAAAVINQAGFAGRNSNLALVFDVRRDDYPSYEADFLIFSPEILKSFSDGLFSFGFTPALIDSKIKSQAGATDLTRGFENIFLVTLGGFFEFNGTDNILDPSNGFTASLDLEIAGEFLGSDEEYFKTVFETTGYADLAEIVFAKKIQLGFIEPFGRTRRKNVPLFSRLFAGGNKSMRGFAFQELGPIDRNKDPLGGNSLITGSFEMRFPIREKLGGVVFLDYGNVFSRSFDYDLDDLKYAIGGGVRYKVVGVPIAFDFGYTLNPNPALRRYQFFLGVGQAF